MGCNSFGSLRDFETILPPLLELGPKGLARNVLAVFLSTWEDAMDLSQGL